MRSRSWWLRAVAPPAAVAAVVAAIALSTGTAADAAPNLPVKTSNELLVMLRDGITTPVHGTLHTSSALGFPALPSSIGGASTTGALGLLSGLHRMRVWENGHGGVRLQLLDQLDETELVVGGGDAWSYVYSTNQAVRLRNGSAGATLATDLLPDRAVARLLAIGTSTTVSSAATTRVAGRAAYRLVVEPLSAATTIGRIDVDIDAATGVALALRIFATGASAPAFSVSYTSVSFGTIAPSTFSFTPPPGSAVSIGDPGSNGSNSPIAVGGATILGSGWASILVLPHLNSLQNKQLSNLADKMGDRVQGGTLISTALVNALFTDDGRVLVGAVPTATLQAAATNPPAAQ